MALPSPTAVQADAEQMTDEKKNCRTKRTNWWWIIFSSISHHFAANQMNKILSFPVFFVVVRLDQCRRDRFSIGWTMHFISLCASSDVISGRDSFAYVREILIWTSTRKHKKRTNKPFRWIRGIQFIRLSLKIFIFILSVRMIMKIYIFETFIRAQSSRLKDLKWPMMRHRQITSDRTDKNPFLSLLHFHLVVWIKLGAEGMEWQKTK